MAKGLLVKERISATTSCIAVGARPCAPKEPRPPKFDTAAVRRCEEKPPSGPWMIGYSMPSWLETRVLFHAEFGFAIIKCRGEFPRLYMTHASTSIMTSTTAGTPKGDWPRPTPCVLRFCLRQKRRGIAQRQHRQLSVDRKSLHALQDKRIAERRGLLYRASPASALSPTKHSERRCGPPLCLPSHPALFRDGQRTSARVRRREACR